MEPEELERLLRVKELALKMAGIGTWEQDLTTGESRWSDEIFEIYGHPPQAFTPNRDRFLQAQHPADLPTIQGMMSEINCAGGPVAAHHRVVRPDGSVRHLESHGIVLFDGNGRAERLVGTSQDVTPTWDALRHLQLVFDHTVELMALIHVEAGRMIIEAVNATCVGFLRKCEVNEHVVGREVESVLSHLTMGDDRIRSARRHLDELVATGHPALFQEEVTTPAGVAFFDIAITPIHADSTVCTHVLFTAHDVTERRSSEQALQRSLDEKDLLLAELHHRVKNNLQLIASLLRLQAGHSAQEPVVQALEDARRRVETLGLVHSQLRVRSDADVDLVSYLRALLFNLRAASGVHTIDFGFDADPPTPISMSMRWVASAGLIVTELVSNALRHAFVGRPGGRVDVRILRNGSSLAIIVKDNGVGIPDVAPTTSSFGLQLVALLARQLRGSIRTRVDRGTETEIRFLER